MSFQTKLHKCFPDFLGFTKFFRHNEMADLPKLLKFGRTCSNWQSAIGMNTKINNIQKWNRILLTSGETNKFQQLQNIILLPTWQTGHRTVQSREGKNKRHKWEHESGVVGDESKQPKCLSSFNYPVPNVYKIH